MEIDSPQFNPRYISAPLGSSVFNKREFNEIPEPVLFFYNNTNAEKIIKLSNDPNYSILEYMNLVNKSDIEALKRSNLGSVDNFIHVITFLLKLKNPNYNVSFHFTKNVSDSTQVIYETILEKKDIGAVMVLFSYPDNNYTLELVYIGSNGQLQCKNTNVTNYNSKLSCLEKFGIAKYIGYVTSPS